MSDNKKISPFELKRLLGSKSDKSNEGVIYFGADDEFEKKPDENGKKYNKEISICKEDLNHHTRFFSTGSFGDGRKTPTPVEVFTFTGAFGIVADDYLEQFPLESEHYEDIQKLKSKPNGE